jgi:isopentenyldiphosphate isomerase
MEFLDIVDENGIPTGETVERDTAHREGVPHRTAHVWIARQRSGQVELLLQKRCKDKDSFPGCYDISSAGHIPAGMDYIPSALRELQEELGVQVSGEDLIECGQMQKDIHDRFRGIPYHDRQFCKVYLLWLDWEEERFRVQQEEIESVHWMEFEACCKAVAENAMPNCIDLAELQLIKERFNCSESEQLRRKPMKNQLR